MAKDISDYARVTTKSAGHLFLYETAVDGVFGHYLLTDLHTIPAGDVIDSDAGVELKFRSGGVLGAKVNTVGNFVVENALSVKGAADMQGRVGIADANGMRLTTALQYFSPGRLFSFTTGGTHNIQGLVLPVLPPGATAVALNVHGFARHGGGAAGTSTNFFVYIRTPADVEGTDTVAVTVNNDGEDLSSQLQGSIDTAVTAFTSAAGRVPQALDSVVIEQTNGSSHHYVVTLELVYT